MGSSHRYVVLGCGRQGTAAALDLVRFGEAAEIVLADASEERARSLAARLGESGPEGAPPVLRPARCDGDDPAALARTLEGSDVVLCAIPYRYIPGVTAAALEAGVHSCDLGGHPGTVERQLELDGRAREAGVAVVPDCGQAPGMSTSLVALAVARVPEPDSVELWDGGLPLRPEPPLHYRLTFDVRGLTNEYDGPCWALRDGEVVALEPLSHRQTVEFDEPLGTLEAFCASGTGSTLPWTLRDRVREFTSRVVRHPGHLDAMRTLRTLGFFGLEPVEVEGRDVVPRRLTEALLEPLLVGEGPIEDVVVVRVHCRGREDADPVRVEVDLRVRHDPEEGLTAMQRCTGFDLAIVAGMLARGEVAPGVSPRERSLDPERYVGELSRRGIRVETRVVRGPGSGEPAEVRTAD